MCQISQRQITITTYECELYVSDMYLITFKFLHVGVLRFPVGHINGNIVITSEKREGGRR